MKKSRKTVRREQRRWTAPIRPSYNFRGGERGKYAQRYSECTNVVLLDPDVAEVFKTSRKVNRVLRAWLKANAVEAKTTRKD